MGLDAGFEKYSANNKHAAYDSYKADGEMPYNSSRKNPEQKKKQSPT